MSNKRLIVALDYSDREDVKALLSQLNPNRCMVKVGLQLYLSQRESILEMISNAGFDIFLDLKLHDIPNTVSKALSEIEKFNVFMTTIHLQGGKEMIEAALSSVQSTKIIGVTLLTSLNDSHIRSLYGSVFSDQFARLISLANDTKIDGLVCSANELNLLHEYRGTKVVPGIRNKALNDDQQRTMTSSEAYNLGADYIVVGRPITQSENIEGAIKEYEY
ncbi:MAG: orotidine-5'-phosphate decarboxylase [SAR86 cluster bacterium]|uniref:Orotidine 5'-phosphate decarboxylase n=1 Tax=SAR86 cluster bacterium TaxID=2030880 RepID=A0A368BLN6_9GAMM|nr:MAG: orotidine-5'-phosphate decarboxylase [SAR86 cluster bacterium]|tara:strand:+ start:26625 stop:27281 length:657 start_codon:yes stop_codon:yes gene_type:complete